MKRAVRSEGEDGMSIEAFYESVGGDLQGVRGRLLTDERIEKFVRMFLADPTFGNLEAAMAAQDMEAAFRAAHTMKGLSRDMGLTRLFGPADELADALRLGEDGAPTAPELADALMLRVAAGYAEVTAAAQLL